MENREFGSNYIRDFNSVPVHINTNMEPDKLLIVYKTKSPYSSNIVHVPRTEQEAIQLIHDNIFKQEQENEEIWDMKQERKFSNIKFIMCNMTDEDGIGKMITSLKKQYGKDDNQYAFTQK